MHHSAGRSGFPWTEPRHRTIFSQIKELEKKNNCVVIFGSVNQRFVGLILKEREDKGRHQIIKICKCLVLVYDARQSKGKLYLYLNAGFLIRVR